MDINTSRSPNNQNESSQGSVAYITDLRQETIDNTLFYTTRWTSKNMQFALMSVPVNTETGLDVHYNSDQFFYIEQGEAFIFMGSCYDCINIQHHVFEGYSIIIPAGVWHNVVNIGGIDLKMFSIFTPAMHTYNTVFRTSQEWFEYYEGHNARFPE
ncbi:cupin domain-containing protein [Kineothrix sp. MB12-C1]|uniref:cupin domain-containing protein n=1 Tax=Kineothrix sp. MB12-C1 TaxID=3070215 RepID=UPI0027D2B0F1|nr:cupin domain-containing protein [Kineothrix sp. MB12-C1]WMC92026.1 cupin domain-containing protein [Kineothrix sp. MB12-C1]